MVSSEDDFLAVYRFFFVKITVGLTLEALKC